MKGLSTYSKQRGFTLIEVGIALAIGLVIIMGVARSIQVNQEKLDASKAVQDIQAILVAAVDYRAGRTDYKGISFENMLLSTDIVGTTAGSLGVGTNPWGGDYTVAVNPDNARQVDIGMTKLSREVGFLLSAKLDPGSVNGDSASWVDGNLTVTYE